MIRIPTPQVGASASPNGRYSAPQVTPQQNGTPQQIEQLGQAVAATGASISRVADYQQDQLDDAYTIEADNLYADEVDRIMNDPKDGYMRQLGRAATEDRRKQVNTELDAAAERVGRTLTNDVQRVQWSRMAKDRRRRATEAADDHLFKQTSVHKVAVLEAGVERALNDGDKDLMVMRTEALAKEIGQDAPEQLDMARLGATTRFHEQQIRSIVDQDPAGAKAMLDSATKAKEIATERVDELTRLVRDSSISDQALRLSMSVITENAKSNNGAGGTEQDALAAIDATFQGKRISADVHARASSHIRTHFNDVAQQQTAETNAALESSKQWFMEPQNRLKGIGSPDFPANLRTSLQQRGKWDELAEFVNNGNQHVNDPDALVASMRIPDAVLAKKTEADIYKEWRGRLSNPDFKVLQAQHARARGASSPDQDSLWTEQQQLRIFAAEAVNLPVSGDLSETQTEQFNTFVQQLDTRLQAFTRDVLQNKRKPSDAERKQVFDAALLEKAKLRSGPGFIGSMNRLGGLPIISTGTEEKPLISMTEAERAKAFYVIDGERVPIKSIVMKQSVEAYIKARLTAAGEPAGPEAIAREWVRAGRPKDAPK